MKVILSWKQICKHRVTDTATSWKCLDVLPFL